MIHSETSTLQPSVIESTSVIVCFSAPTSSIFSPGGSCMVGNLWNKRTTVYAASFMLRIGRVTVAYDCLEMVTAACGSLRLPNLAIMYLVAHYTWIEHSASSASIHYMTDTCSCA
jgi:hypothetical protein